MFGISFGSNKQLEKLNMFKCQQKIKDYRNNKKYRFAVHPFCRSFLAEESLNASKKDTQKILLYYISARTCLLY